MINNQPPPQRPAAVTKRWVGRDYAEADAAKKRALELGLNQLHAEIFGHWASFKDNWTPQRTIAALSKCSVRTVQRASRKQRELGILECKRAKRGEIPPGATSPRYGGFSHRWVVGRGQTGPKLKRAVEEARARWIRTHAVQELPKALRKPRRRSPHADFRPASGDELMRKVEQVEAEARAQGRPPPWA